MATIVEQIEAYLKELIRKSQVDTIEIKRNDLANLFMCVPSQINYVLGTRFTPERGFVVETRRGGGGFIRITRLTSQHKQIIQNMEGCLNKELSDSFVMRLYEEGFITKREAILIREMQKLSFCLDEQQKETLSSQILRALAMILREG